MARGSLLPDVGLTLTGTAAAAADIRGADRACHAAIRRATRAAGRFCKELTAGLAPKATGFMASKVRTDYAPDGLSFETGWRVSDFEKAGQPFYPPFVELGTQRAPAQPSLYPAFKETQRFYAEEIRQHVRDAAARHRLRGR